MADDYLLDGFDLTPDENEPYTKVNLHVNETGQKWSIQALLWKPGSKTAIHNHKCWCSFGMYLGEVAEQVFDEDSNIISETSLLEGEIKSYTPDGDDIHRMVNKTEKLAISIHFYGINGNKQNSILKIFD